jgi:outer membrane protein assembly factor BamB
MGVVVAGDQLLVADVETLYAFDRTSGEQRWQAPLRPNETDRLRQIKPLAVRDGTVYHQSTPESSDSGVGIVARSLADGTIDTQYDLGYPNADSASPGIAIAGDRLYALTMKYSTQFDVIDLSAGERVETPVTSGPDIQYDTNTWPTISRQALFATGDGTLTAFS